MKSDDTSSAKSKPLEGKDVGQLTELSRTSNWYASVPNRHRGGLNNREGLEATANDTDYQVSSFGTDRRRRKRFHRNPRKHLSDNQAVDEYVNAVDHTFLNSIAKNEYANDYAAFGLSNDLSTESLRNACEFYDDEPSDDDLIEVQSIPESFQKQSSLRRSLKGNCFNVNSRKKHKNSDADLLCVSPSASKDGTTDCPHDDAMSVLHELDAILDVHDMPELQTTDCPDGGYEMETKVEDCLLDLDNYLEKMDDCSVSIYDNEDVPNRERISKHQQLHTPYRSRTLPTSRETASEAEIGSATDVNEISGGAFRRAHGFRKTISCSLERNRGDFQSESPESQEKLNPIQIWRRNSMRRASSLMLSDMLYSGGNDLTGTYPNEIEASPRVFQSDSPEKNITAEQSAGAGSQENLDDEPTSPISMTTGSELRRCFSQSDFSTRHSSINRSEMLTQDDIFHNLLIQNESNQHVEDRPRQFGRRAQGHPRILSLRTGASAEVGGGCSILNYNQRPMSAPATESAAYQERHSALYIGSDISSVRSSQIPSPISLVSSSDSTSTAASTNAQIEVNLVANENLQPHSSPLDPENTLIQLRAQPGFNSEWPHAFSRTLALVCCTLGLFNICRFAMLTIHYGGNFVLQFLLLSILFGIPLLWLQMCLGAKIKCGPVSMWKITPICKGIGIALALVQCLMAIYSTVAIAWLLVYLRDSFLNKNQTVYRWQEPLYTYRQNTNDSSSLTENVADYFNVVVLQRLQYGKRIENGDIRFRVSDRLAFNLAILWAAVFLILCKGLKSFGKVVFALGTVPLITLGVVTCKFLYVVDLTKLQNIFSAADFDDFLINSKTWTAAAQETFLTWGLLGSSVIAITSRTHATNANSKTALRRDAILVVLVTLLGLSMASILGLSCIQILKQHSYVYIPGSYEQPESSTAVYSLRAPINAELLSFPSKWVPHYSSFVGETYKRPAALPHRESGYQALRFISELFPAAIALSIDSISWVWTAIMFGMFFLFGLAQLCIMWKPISNALGNSTSSVLLSCVTALLLSIPFTTEVGISILHYMDLLLGGAWFIPILLTAQIFGVFLVRGRPYNGDDLVNDLRMSGSMSAFLALSWNVLLPIGLITLSIINYKTSYSNQFYYWRGKSYFSYWARKVAGLTQIGVLLLVPITAIVQIYRHLTNGPPDILERIQLLYRPAENATDNRRNRTVSRNRGGSGGGAESGNTADNQELHMHSSQEDAPPKYTPPPSYTTATGARIAKILRQSIRRSVRRILGEPGRSRPILRIDTEMSQQSLPPDYSTVLTHPSGNVDSHSQTAADTIDVGQRPADETYTQRSVSLGRSAPAQKQRRGDSRSRPTSTSRSSNSRRPYTAEDVVTVLRSSARFRQDRGSSPAQEVCVTQTQADNSFRSIENLILNEAPLGHSPALVVNCDAATDAEISNEHNDTTVI